MFALVGVAPPSSIHMHNDRLSEFHRVLSEDRIDVRKLRQLCFQGKARSQTPTCYNIILKQYKFLLC